MGSSYDVTSQLTERVDRADSAPPHPALPATLFIIYREQHMEPNICQQRTTHFWSTFPFLILRDAVYIFFSAKRIDKPRTREYNFLLNLCFLRQQLLVSFAEKSVAGNNSLFCIYFEPKFTCLVSSGNSVRIWGL